MRLVPTSLAGRLLAGSAVFTTVALLFALLVMHQVLDRFVTGQIDQRLDNKIVALASQVEVAADGTVRLSGDADGPPFDRPHHRSFWWIGGPKNDLHTGWLRSGDFSPPTDAAVVALPAPPAPPPDGGPDLPAGERARSMEGKALAGVAMHMRLARRTLSGRTITFVAAAPREAIDHPMREAMISIGFAVAALGLALVVATFVQVRLGLRPLTRLRGAVAAVREGSRTELPTGQPREILPLVVELNALLFQNAENLVRARRHVANLAHGLKTPLATLSLAIERLQGEDRAQMQNLIGLMERRVRHHLGRARTAALDGPVRVRTPLAERIADIADALKKIHADKPITLTIACPPDLAVACEPQDVDEMLGNLLENAFKYTRGRVDCDIRTAIGSVVVSIGDDGPGLTPEQILLVQERGRRLDEEVPGHGFGLPIARELAELYAGELLLSPGEVGLMVRLILPRSF